MSRDIKIGLSDLGLKYPKKLYQLSCLSKNKIVKYVGQIFKRNLRYAQKELYILSLRQKRDKRILSLLCQMYQGGKFYYLFSLFFSSYLYHVLCLAC